MALPKPKERVLFSVCEEHLLMALQRALYEAKFRNPEASPELVGSPFVSAVYRDVVNSIIRLEDGRGRRPAADVWRAWLRLDAQPDIIALIHQRIVACGCWRAWSQDRKADFVRELAAPFEVSESTLDSLIRDGDSAHSK